MADARVNPFGEQLAPTFQFGVAYQARCAQLALDAIKDVEVSCDQREAHRFCPCGPSLA